MYSYLLVAATGALKRSREELPPHLRSGAAAGRTYPMPEAKGIGREQRPHLQGVVAVWAKEGLEELFHIQGQEGRW